MNVTSTNRSSTHGIRTAKTCCIVDWADMSRETTVFSAYVIYALRINATVWPGTGRRRRIYSLLPWDTWCHGRSFIYLMGEDFGLIFPSKWWIWASWSSFPPLIRTARQVPQENHRRYNIYHPFPADIPIVDSELFPDQNAVAWSYLLFPGAGGNE